VVLRPRLVAIAWVAIGLVIAVSRDYLEDVDTVKEILSAVLAVFLWPLLLLGIDLHVR
jgi:ABC-type anion transport system duplicated permease subunit